MVFDNDHDSPWWIATLGGRRAWQYSILPAEDVAPKRSDRTNKLKPSDALHEEAGITVDPFWPLAEIRELAIPHGIDMMYDKVQNIEGWQGKPKELLNFLWERG